MTCIIVCVPRVFKFLAKAVVYLVSRPVPSQGYGARGNSRFSFLHQQWTADRRLRLFSPVVCTAVPVKEAPQIKPPWIEDLARLERPPKQPTVLTPTEVNLVLAQMTGVDLLFCRLHRQGMLRQATLEIERIIGPALAGQHCGLLENWALAPYLTRAPLP